MKKLLLAITIAAAGLLNAGEPKRIVADPAAAETYLANQPDVQILDVRTLEEFQTGCISKSICISWTGGGFSKGVAGKLDSSKPILVYCHSGARSAKAADELVRLGFKDVCDLKGGIVSWKKARKSIVIPKPDERP
jgi:rhodanese-related sulfurtransferase